MPVARIIAHYVEPDKGARYHKGLSAAANAGEQQRAIDTGLREREGLAIALRKGASSRNAVSM